MPNPCKSQMVDGSCYELRDNQLCVYLKGIYSSEEDGFYIENGEKPYIMPREMVECYWKCK